MEWAKPVQVQLVHLASEIEISSHQEIPFILEVVQIDHTVHYTQEFS